MKCIIGGYGKIGTMFRSLHRDAHLPKFGEDYDEYNISSKFEEVLKSCNTIIMCHHNIQKPWQIYILTQNILKFIKNDADTTIINIASDAELIWMPFRIEYGKMKKRLRKLLFDRKNRTINIFFPHVTPSNYEDLYFRLATIDFKYDNYYLSPLSAIIRPCLVRHAYWNETDLEPIYFENNSKLSQVLDDKAAYEKIRGIVENKLRIELVPFDDLFFKFVMWKLQFEGFVQDGKWHLDMKRCLFGNSLRTILCVDNTSDYKLAIENDIVSMSKNDIIVIPDGVWHQPTTMSHGKRTIIIFDFFTSRIPNIIAVFLFLIFNQLKVLGINV